MLVKARVANREAPQGPTMKPRVLLLGVVALGCAAPNAVAEPARHVCNVETVDSKGPITVLRGRQELMLVPYLPLLVGDRIRLGDNVKAEITLRCGAERLVKHGDFVVEHHAEPPTRSRNAMAWLSRFFFEWDHGGESVATVASRGVEDSPALMMIDGEAVIGAGRKRLSVAWAGGEAPFVVRLRREGAEVDAAQAVAAESHSARFSLEAAMEPGHFEVSVTDARQRTGRGRLRAVPIDKLPTPPDDFSASDPGDVVGLTLEASWLAAVGHGDLDLEAYQRLAALAPRHRPAAGLLAGLEAGFRLSPP